MPHAKPARLGCAADTPRVAGPNASVFAYASAQAKKAMDVTQLLGGENFVFWGGREGYQSLINTDMELELDNLAR